MNATSDLIEMVKKSLGYPTVEPPVEKASEQNIFPAYLVEKVSELPATLSLVTVFIFIVGIAILLIWKYSSGQSEDTKKTTEANSEGFDSAQEKKAPIKENRTMLLRSAAVRARNEDNGGKKDSFVAGEWKH